MITLTADDAPVFAVVVEVQLRPDPNKRWSWPVYLATLRARLHCPAALLVVCAGPATASWCATPIELGHPGWTLTPLVLAPDRVPAIIDPGQAEDSPELAVLSAMAHGDHPDRDKILHALVAGLESVDQDHANLYTDLVLAALPAAARHHLEALMAIGTYEYQSDFARRYYGQAKADAVLTILSARGFDVPDDVRVRIAECTDFGRLEAWIRRAATANAVDDLFTEP